MQLKSLSFQPNTMIPPKFTCQGQNINPALEFVDIGPQAKSLALIMTDEDAHEGEWVHWVVWDIPVDTAILEEGCSGKNLKEGLNDFDFHGYGGPCPPSKIHRYKFVVYALDVETLNLSADTTATELLHIIESHITDSCELVGLYSKLDK